MGTERREFLKKSFWGTLGMALTGMSLNVKSATLFEADHMSRLRLELHSIDKSRVGKAVPDSSAAIDIDGDGHVEVLSSMQNANGYPEVFLYKHKNGKEWERTKIGIVKQKEEIEWVAAGQPFPGDSRICVACSVQHKKDGLVVFRLREPGLFPFNPKNWEQGVAKEYAGQGLAFRDLDGDGIEELVYATQAGNELGVLKVKENGDPLSKSGWIDHVINSGNQRSWWWLNDKFYDLNGNGLENDFFVSTRAYGGKGLGMWKVIQNRPNDLSSYTIHKIYNGNSMQFDTGFFFSSNRYRKPDIVMVEYKSKQVFLMDGRNNYTVSSIPFEGVPWNIKVIPFLKGSRDAFVVAATKSPSLFWSFQYREGYYEVRQETGHAGNYGHPFDGKFTIADVDGDGKPECVVPDSSMDKQSKGLAYLKGVPVKEEEDNKEPFERFKLG